MSLQQLSLESQAVDVALSMSGTRLAVLSDTHISVYATDMTKRPVPVPTLLWRENALDGHVPRHVAFLGDDKIFVLTDSWDEEESSLWTSTEEELVYRGPILEPGRVSSITSSVDYQKLYLHFQDGTLYEVEAPNESQPQTTQIHRFPTFAPEVRVVMLDDKASLSDP